MFCCSIGRYQNGCCNVVNIIDIRWEQIHTVAHGDALAHLRVIPRARRCFHFFSKNESFRALVDFALNWRSEWPSLRAEVPPPSFLIALGDGSSLPPLRSAMVAVACKLVADTAALIACSACGARLIYCVRTVAGYSHGAVALACFAFRNQPLLFLFSLKSKACFRFSPPRPEIPLCKIGSPTKWVRGWVGIKPRTLRYTPSKVKRTRKEIDPKP